MTGNQIRVIRQAFGLSIDQFARVLGVHPVTLNRWELARETEPNIDGMAWNLLTGLKERLIRVQGQRRAAKAQAAQTGQEIENLLALGGILLALGALLTFINAKPR